MGMLIDNTHADSVHSFIRGGESTSTGPKISSRLRVEAGSTSTKMVGPTAAGHGFFRPARPKHHHGHAD
jgi:hypothetical protein